MAHSGGMRNLMNAPVGSIDSSTISAVVAMWPAIKWPPISAFILAERSMFTPWPAFKQRRLVRSRVAFMASNFTSVPSISVTDKQVPSTLTLAPILSSSSSSGVRSRVNCLWPG
ncbi:hypothetical protein D3C79_950290 [compost metagenome]